MIETDTEGPNAFTHTFTYDKCLTVKCAEETMSTDVYM